MSYEQDLLKFRKLLTRDNYARQQQKRSRTNSSIVSGEILGVDSSASYNGNPMAVVKTPRGIIRSELISNGRVQGKTATVVFPKNELFGIVSSMPRGSL